MASSSLSRRALLLFFLEVAVAMALLLPGGHARVCPPCGSTEVPYPLSTADGCGDPEYKVRCAARRRGHGATLLFDALNGTSYPITSISPASQRLVVSPAPFVSPGACVSVGAAASAACSWTRRGRSTSARPTPSCCSTARSCCCGRRSTAPPTRSATPTRAPRVDGVGVRAAAAVLHVRGGGSSTSYRIRLGRSRAARTGASWARPVAAAGDVGQPPRAGAAVGDAEGAAVPHAGRLRGRRAAPAPTTRRQPEARARSGAACACPGSSGIPSLARASSRVRLIFLLRRLTARL